MDNLLTVIAVLMVWCVLQVWLLPRLGVPTFAVPQRPRRAADKKEDIMRVRVIASWVVAIVAAGVFTAAAGSAAPRRQWAVATFARSTWVTDRRLVGSYLIVHDDDRMARGEPCTSFYRVGTGGLYPFDEVVSFHCIPRQRKPVRAFSMTVASNEITETDRLLEYQFAGDSEGHGVPLAARTSLPASSLECVRDMVRTSH